MQHLLDATAPAVLLITEPRSTGLSTSWTAVWRLRGFGCGCAPEHVRPVDGVDYDQVVTERLEKTPQWWATPTVDRTTRPGVWLSCYRDVRRDRTSSTGQAQGRGSRRSALTCGFAHVASLLPSLAVRGMCARRTACRCGDLRGQALDGRLVRGRRSIRGAAAQPSLSTRKLLEVVLVQDVFEVWVVLAERSPAERLGEMQGSHPLRRARRVPGRTSLSIATRQQPLRPSLIKNKLSWAMPASALSDRTCSSPKSGWSETWRPSISRSWASR